MRDDLLQARLREALARIQQGDSRLAQELNEVRASRESREKVREAVDGFVAEAAVLEAGPPQPPEPDFVLETIVLKTGRPVLAIVHDEPRLEFHEVESEIWKERLTAAREPLVRAIRAVGRIEVAHHPRFEWIGTGWLVADDVVVTNRHVANEFGRRSGSGFVFRQGTGRTMRPSIDFLEEVGRLESRELRVKRVLHIEADGGPDMALVQVETVKGRMQPPIALAASIAEKDRQVAVIGYPAKDSRIPDQQLMQNIFGDVFDKKRLAPGQIIAGQPGTLSHDCSTLGGNSGSVVLDLQTGEALGLHFAGRFLEANFAVPAPVVADRLRNLGRAAAPAAPRPRVVVREEGKGPAGATLQAASQEPPTSSTSVSVTIPIRVTVDIGLPAGTVPVSAAAPPRPPRPPVAPPSGEEEDDGELILGGEEARVEDYANRAGYDPAFLGEDFEVPLPELGEEMAADAVTYDRDGEEDTVLRYQHFSVVMSRRRRLCFYSAGNVDGKHPQRFKRPGWRFDPRIPKELQILQECYGNAPKFARGHMTRREDPIWGPEKEAALGNEDSMHATNVVPQLQIFNAGIWLGLEEYALDNAREDDMRISVFTGPFLREDDPVLFGVKIPRSFWKVIAFLHDETGELSATGYTLSQEAFLQDVELVFGEHETKTHVTTQVPIALIEQETGLSFGELAARDPLAEAEEALPAALTEFRQIRLVAR